MLDGLQRQRVQSLFDPLMLALVIHRVLALLVWFLRANFQSF